MSTEEFTEVVTPTVQSYYDESIDFVRAMAGEISQSNMPTTEVMAWGNQVSYLLKTDLAPLVANGFDESIGISLPARVGTFVVAASETLLAKDLKGEYSEELAKAEPALHTLIEEISEAIYYGCRNDSDVLSALTRIEEGSGRKNDIFDLVSLYKLGMDNKPALEAVKFDCTKLETALTEHTRLAELLTASENSPADIEEKQDIKNRAFTWLVEALDEIEACARYTFGRKSERYAQYKSSYWKRRRS